MVQVNGILTVVHYRSMSSWLSCRVLGCFLQTKDLGVAIVSELADLLIQGMTKEDMYILLKHFREQ